MADLLVGVDAVDKFVGVELRTEGDGIEVELSEDSSSKSEVEKLVSISESLSKESDVLSSESTDEMDRDRSLANCWLFDSSISMTNLALLRFEGEPKEMKFR